VTQILFHNGAFITMDRDRPRAEAVLVKEDRIDFVGSNAEARSRAPVDAEVVDLAGRAVLPGFNDNHTHTMIGGFTLSSTDLGGLSEQRIVEKLLSDHAGTPEGEPIWAFNWDYPAVPHPHKSILDRAFPRNPVVLSQFGGHGHWVNSMTLERMRIDRDTPDPPRGTILRDESGEPTGVLREMNRHPYMQRLFVKMHTDSRTMGRSLDRMLGEYARLGITSVQDNTWYPAVFRVLAGYRDSGRLTARFQTWTLGEIPWFVLPVWVPIRLTHFDDRWMKRGPYKYFLDGTFTTRSAALMEDYADEPGNPGKGKSQTEMRNDFLARRVRKRQQVACHAIGDRAIKELLDAVEMLQRQYPWTKELRLRIEHAQLIREQDIPRLRRLGVQVSAQPHAMGTPEKYEALLGTGRFQRAYPYRWLIDEGVALSFGSDYPGEPTLNPLQAVQAAATRPGPQRITVEEALRCYTAGSAFAEGGEDQKGTIAAGKLADLAVLSEDPLSLPASRVGEIRVLSTYVGGKVVYDGQRVQGMPAPLQGAAT
jgi:predicted amidohydrolase YtcJ